MREVDDLEKTVRHLETAGVRDSVRSAVGGSAGSGIASYFEFPEIPTQRAELIYMIACRVEFPPGGGTILVPNEAYVKQSGLWYAAPGDTVWKPCGGKCVAHRGSPGYPFIFF